jgi:hypothetical protein
MSRSFLKLVGISALVVGAIDIVPIALSSDVMGSKPSSTALTKVLDHYWLIEQIISQNSVTGITEKAELMIPVARTLGDKKLSKEIRKEAKSLAENAGDTSGHASIERAREDFKILSTTLAGYLKNHPQNDWQVFRCREAMTNWVQKKDTPMKNPFEMNGTLGCGEKI